MYDRGRVASYASSRGRSGTTAAARESVVQSQLLRELDQMENAVRAVEKVRTRMDEVEKQHTSLNDNVKNCAQLIKLTQSFAEQQGREQAREFRHLANQVGTLVETASHSQAEETAGRVERLQQQMKEMVALKLGESQSRETEMSNFQSSMLHSSHQFEATLTDMTKRHAEILYTKLDEDARSLVSDRVQARTAPNSHICVPVMLCRFRSLAANALLWQAEVSGIMGKVERMVNSTMVRDNLIT
jgi:hypothetical protein